MSRLPARIDDLDGWTRWVERQVSAIEHGTDYLKLRGVRDRAYALQALAQAQRASAAVQNAAAEVRLRAEARLGEMTSSLPRASSGARGHQAKRTRANASPSASELGITRRQRQEYERLAAAAKTGQLDAFIDECKTLGNPISTRAAIRRVSKGQAAKRARVVNLGEEVSGRFSVILADPPWRYANTGLAGNVRTHPDLPYPSMPTEEICALPVRQRATTNAVLFLWVTNPFLVDGLAVVRAWGFEYRTQFVWLKNRAAAAGFYCRSRTEMLWVCVRGSGMTVDPKRLASNVIEAPVAEHSRKPDAVHKLIERYYPRARKLELFARRRRRGWTTWGNEVPAPKGVA